MFRRRGSRRSRKKEVRVDPEATATIWQDDGWMFALELDLGLVRWTSDVFGPYPNERETVKQARKKAKELLRAAEESGRPKPRRSFVVRRRR